MSSEAAFGRRLEGKTIVVVGGGSGIGAATGKRLAREGAHVVIGDLSADAAHAVAEALNAEGLRATGAGCDVTDETSIVALIDIAMAEGGLHGIHINPADMQALLRDTDVLSVPLELFDRTMTVNLRGHLLCTRAALPAMLKSGGGAIVYTSSDAAFAGETERVSYAISKNGIHGLMRHVATRWGREGIRANAVAPGFVITDEMRVRGVKPQFEAAMISATPSPRLGWVEDIAAMVAMLMSDDGAWINGQVYSVNGGILLR